MVTPVDEIALRTLGAIGLTLPIFLLAVDAFQSEGSDREAYSEGFVLVAICTLISSGSLAAISLMLPPRADFWKNLLVDAATTLLVFGYLGLGLSIYEIMGLEFDDIGCKGWIWVAVTGFCTITVIILNIVIRPA